MKSKSGVEVREIITIGSDPEFTLVQPDSGTTVNAHEVYKPNNPHSINTEFGLDGHSATGEIRPKPADTPKKAVQAIKELLEENKKKYPQAYKYNLKATSNRLQLGGHIHFGNKKFLSPTGRLNSVGLTLVHNLDNLLAFPSMYLENKEHAQTRRHTSYGGFSDARAQTWGFEYRTLSSFIASKELTSCIFYLGHAIADATLGYDYKCKELVQKDGFNHAFKNQARELLKPHLTYVFRQHGKLPLYKEKKDYRQNIDLFQVAVKKELPLFDTEIKKGWKIEFDISDFWKVERLETLLEKITKLLIAIHTLKRKNFKPVIHRFVKGSHEDIGCLEIANRVNIAINNLVDAEVIKSHEWKNLRVYGLKESRGNEVWISNNSLTEDKRRKQVLAYLWEIASEFTHKSKIEDIRFNGSMNSHSIAFGRKLREENLLVAETMVVITLLLINRDLFKQTQKVKGKTKKLLITKHKVVDTVVKNLKNTKQFKAVIPNIVTDKLNNVELPLLFDLNQSFDQLYSKLASLNAEEKREVAEICKRRFREVFQGILATSCIAKCGEKHNLHTVKLIKLCPLHICRAIERSTVSLPSVESRGWAYVFTPDALITCTSCDNDVPQSSICRGCEVCSTNNCCNCYVCRDCSGRFNDDNFCRDCGNCHECCNYCSVCESHTCEHFTCDGCSDDVDAEDFCSDCNRCNDCWEHCGECRECVETAGCGDCEDCCECERAEDESEPSGASSDEHNFSREEGTE